MTTRLTLESGTVFPLHYLIGFPQPWRYKISLSPFYRWGNWSLVTFPRSEVVSGRATWTGLPVCGANLKASMFPTEDMPTSSLQELSRALGVCHSTWTRKLFQLELRTITFGFNGCIHSTSAQMTRECKNNLALGFNLQSNGTTYWVFCWKVNSLGRFQANIRHNL